MKVIIAGSRGVTELKQVEESMDLSAIDFSYITEVVSGAARGADRLGEEWAFDRNILTQVFYPDWEKYGKGAGYIRNRQMAKYADRLVAVWDGQSKGTKHMIDLMRAANKPVYIHTVL